MSAHISAVVDILHDTTLSTEGCVEALRQTDWFKFVEVSSDTAIPIATVRLCGVAMRAHHRTGPSGRAALREAVAAAFDAVGDHTHAQLVRSDPPPGGAAAFIGRAPSAPVTSTCPNCGHELSAEPQPR